MEQQVFCVSFRLVVGVGVKRRADRRGSTVHGTASVLCEFQVSCWGGGGETS